VPLLAEEIPDAVQYIEQQIDGFPFGAQSYSAPASPLSCALGEDEAPSPAILAEAVAPAECGFRGRALWVHGLLGTVQEIGNGVIDVATDDEQIVHVPVLALNLGVDTLEKV
jgi:hypothetical protein